MDHIQTIVFDSSTKLNDNGESVLASLDQLEDLEDSLDLIAKVTNDMAMVVKVLSKLPYVGGLITILYKAMDTIVSNTVTPVQKQIASVNKKVADKKVRDRLTSILDKNVALADALLNIETRMNEIVKTLPLVDSVCPTLIGDVTEAYCQKVGSALDTPNAQLASFEGTLNSVSSFVSDELSPVIDLADTFQHGSTWKSIGPILKTLSTVILNPLNAFLNKSFGACIPTIVWNTRRSCSNVDYPCGTNMCENCFKIFGRKSCSRYEYSFASAQPRPSDPNPPP